VAKQRTDWKRSVKAGLRNARAKGERLGRPKKALDIAEVAALRKKAVHGAKSPVRWNVRPRRRAEPKSAEVGILPHLRTAVPDSEPERGSEGSQAEPVGTALYVIEQSHKPEVHV